jgi:hypothetical protein
MVFTILGNTVALRSCALPKIILLTMGSLNNEVPEYLAIADRKISIDEMDLKVDR